MPDLQANSPVYFLPQNGILSQITALGFEPFDPKPDTLRKLAIALLERTK